MEHDLAFADPHISWCTKLSRHRYYVIAFLRKSATRICTACDDGKSPYVLLLARGDSADDRSIHAAFSSKERKSCALIVVGSLRCVADASALAIVNGGFRVDVPFY